MYGMDFRGNTCGKGDLSSYKHQYWPNVLYYKQLGSVCLSDCPSSPSAFSSSSWSGSPNMVCSCAPKIAEGNTGSTGNTGADSTYSMTVESSLNQYYTSNELGANCNTSPWKEL